MPRLAFKNLAEEFDETPAAEPQLPQPVSDESLARFFGEGGLLSRALPGEGRAFEHRDEQQQMAEAVAAAARDRAHLLVEAGTGTGKSYAYLVPLILWAVENGKKVLIATHTKALQQQLVERDLPFLRTLLQEKMGISFRSALCLGTGNYVCPRRLAKAEVGGLFATKDDVADLERINSFAHKSKTGRLTDLSFEPSPQLWGQINRESDLCMGRNCPLYDDSFFYKARREQEKAHVLVANHHLLFAHLAAGGNEAGAVLPSFDAVVIDEAHQAEEVASTYLGIEVVNLGVAKLIEMLHHRRGGKTILSGATNVMGIEQLEKSIVDAAEEAREAAGRFFGELLDAAGAEVSRTQTIRLRGRSTVENSLDEPLGRLESLLREARKKAESAKDEAHAKEWDGFAGRCAEMRLNLRELLGQQRPDYVYWLAVAPRTSDLKSRVPRVALCGAPIDVAEGMQTNLFGPICPVVLTSATMTTGGKFQFLRERLGLVPERCDKEVRELVLGSPFDYEQNALLYVGKDLPDPSQPAVFERAAIERAAELVKRTRGRAFVLCTSFRMVDATAETLQKALPRKIRVLRQGEMPRGKLLDEFRKDTDSVLVGTTSFWQGVDVPGESLTCVVMMKLPFAVPDDPLVQARVESLRERGRNPFNEYQVPQAIMMFRQGFGRLIRTREDKGIVAILDPRLVSKSYGQTFLRSLPPCAVTTELDAVTAFIDAMDAITPVTGKNIAKNDK
ncbi:MAG TPA: ATP-dependent DNA helicase [Abditibacteriaceae bacterium]